MSRSKWYAKLTPQMAWEQYMGEPVERFISEFHAEGVTEVGEMCRRYAKDLPGTFKQLFSLDQLARIARLLEQYIQEKGCDETKLYTKEELDELWEREVEELFQALGRYFREK